MSVQWCDFSEFQRVIGDTYPHPVTTFRSNDGTYRDQHFAQNHAWAKAACDSGKLAFFIVYAVYEPDGGSWVSTLMSMVGTPHPRMVVMMDIESWGGRIAGDHSSDINAGRARIAQWLGDSRRVIGYGNMSDLRNLWPNRGDAQVVVAAYGFTPKFPNMIAHQYTSSASCPPFGAPVDMNSADDHDLTSLSAALGISAPITPPVVPPVNSGGNMFIIYNAAAGAAPADRQLILLTVDGGQIRARYLEDRSERAVFVAAVPPIPVTACDQPTWDGILARVGYVYGQPIPPLTVAATGITVDLTDAQLQAIEQGVASAITAAGVGIPQAQVDAIATAVRAQFTDNPLTATPFELK